MSKKKILLFVLMFVSIISSSVLNNSPAIRDDALSVIVNPAGLAEGRGANIALHSSLAQDSLIEAAIATGLVGMGFRREKETDAFFFSTGHRTSKALSFGTRLGFIQNRLVSNSSYQFDIGTLFRPVQWLSLGITTDGLIGAGGAHILQCGVAVRPVNIVTIGASSKYLDAAFNGTAITLALDLNGMALQAAYSPDDNKWNAALSFSLSNSEFGYSHPLDGAGKNGSIALWMGKDRKEPVVNGPRKVAVIEISGVLTDGASDFSLFGGGAQRLSDILIQLRNGARDEDIGQIILRIGQIRAGFGMLDEIRSAIKDLRLVNKRITACLESVEPSSYYLAAAADRIIVEPLSPWVMTGIGAEVSFYKGLFDKLGVKANFLRVGEYKNYPEVFTDDSMSAKFRENEIMLLSSWYNHFIDNIVTDRGVDRDTFAAVLDRGSIPLSEACSIGLINEIGYYRDIFEELAPKRERPVNLRNRSYYKREWSGGSKIAIVVIEGTIVNGESFTDFFSGESFVGSRTICDILAKIRKDKRVKGVVLRVNSPGGSGSASDQIWREVKRLRESGKPVVASVGDVAASGGYFVMAGADAIFAGEGAVIGSIGVFAGKFVLKGLYDKFGIKKELITFGRNADLFSDYKEFSEEQVTTMQASLEEFYSGFLNRVAEGRNISKDSANVLGRGRVFSGEQALARGLIDEIGGLAEAINSAKVRAGFDEAAPIGIDLYPKPRGFFAELSGGEAKVKRRILGAVTEMARDGSMLAIMPYRFHLR